MVVGIRKTPEVTRRRLVWHQLKSHKSHTLRKR
jgi:hypothetical protein